MPNERTDWPRFLRHDVFATTYRTPENKLPTDSTAELRSPAANIKGSENELPADGSGQQQSGNGSGGVQQSRVSPSLQNAAARLTTVGVTPLRKAAIGSMLATGFLQEHDTLTQWVRAQGLTGHSKREALTEARALELGVADYGVEFLTRPSAEVLLRRILALAIHSGTGSWQIAEKIEELPT